MKAVAIIPARGGSKRIPRKNIRDFCGRPIIAWSIQAALESGCFERVIVSTDDEEIAAVARRCGAETPFLRPAALADDYAGTVPVIAHAIEWLQIHGDAPEAVCCLYATAPLVQPEDIRRGRKALESESVDYTFSVTSYAFPIQRALRITDNGRAKMFYPEHVDTRSQDLEEAWHDAGQFYWGRSSSWVSAKPILTTDAIPIRLPRERVQDIDTPEDWQRAQWLLKAMQVKESDGE
ncbi:pseudaminic acid cytidylyltransferase [Endozoicomonas sp. G2_2]|uniref:pseudaminic acid cytidylyltransferase n=1 Tax=Endozoicomonas sp. G2_2 TaxID=2821092 RepID=UPI001ADADC88|nr:pseudaminic acid cytidylyltransferase [Endozoicomonas sp. G2_2]MBO9469660.1 pseudaminic acid cytidylyltransferase [Endozoicomonas sp. G2_2]